MTPRSAAQRPALAQWLGSILWPAFLSAGVATAVFFANLDPETLRVATAPDWEISRMTGYAVGFFMFWGATTLSSALTLWLFRVPARADGPREGGRSAE